MQETCKNCKNKMHEFCSLGVHIERFCANSAFKWKLHRTNTLFINFLMERDFLFLFYNMPLSVCLLNLRMRKGATSGDAQDKDTAVVQK